MTNVRNNCGKNNNNNNNCNSCNCCDCNIYENLLKNKDSNLNYNMGRNKTYLACIYPMQRSATVIPGLNTLNNLNPKRIVPNGCNTSGSNPCGGNECNECTNYNFPGSSADYCSQSTECNRLGIRMYRGVMPLSYCPILNNKCNSVFGPQIPQDQYDGSMNSLTPSCKRQCCCNENQDKICGQCCGDDCDNNSGCGC